MKPTLVLVGRPNVGKSSIFNKLIGEEKAIVSPIPHTTREPNDTLVEYQDKLLNFIDTAGLKKQAKVASGLEEFSYDKTQATIAKANVALFMIDISQPISTLDKKIGASLEWNHARDEFGGRCRRRAACAARPSRAAC